MDQIVERPQADTPAGDAQSAAAALGLDEGGRSRRRLRRWLLALAAFAAAALAAGAWYWQEQAPVRIVYQTEPAALTDLVVKVSATGTLQPLTQVDVSSELSGVVRSVAVDENQEVRKGDVLAELDRTRIAAQVERAKAAVQAAEAQLLQAETTLKQSDTALDRATRLSRSGMIAQQALDTAAADRDRAAAAVATAKANVAVAQADQKMQEADLAKSTIYAPIDGMVLTRSVDPGQTVAASLQAPVLFVIAEDLKRMQLEAAIDEADIGRVAKGQRGRFTVDAFPERPFDATISDIAYASVTTDNVVTYQAKLDVDNSQLLLRPGMTASVDIVTREGHDVLTVPNAAFRYSPPAQSAPRGRGFSLQDLFMPRFPGRGQRPAAATTGGDGSRILYVLADGTPKRTAVQVGATDGARTEILSGLQAGAEVVLSSSAQGG